MKLDKKFKRKCVCCGVYKNKEDLIKITKTKDNKIILNPSTLDHGRSIYICKNNECLKNAIKNKKLNKALKIQIPNEIILAISQI